MRRIIVITGASSGFCALTARAAQAGHTAYASMRETLGRSAPQAAEVIRYAVTQRVNRAALPYLRKQGSGLVLWVSSSNARDGTPPYLAPYFAAKAAMDSLAVSYAGELTRWCIDTSIVVPRAFTKGINHFVHSGIPANSARAIEYHEGPYAGVPEQGLQGLAALEPADADVADVARAIVDIVGMPQGRRPFRRHIDPSPDGAEIVNAMADRVRSEMLRRIGLEDLLHTRVNGPVHNVVTAEERCQ